MGCYTMQPIRVDPQVGTVIAVDVNDAGRAALSGSMGPDLSQVQGPLVEKDSTGYLVSVSSVRLRQGGEQVWSGERIRIRSEYLYTVYQRRFSVGRTVAISAIGAGGIGAIILTTSLLGSAGSGNGNGGCVEPDCPTSRVGRP